MAGADHDRQRVAFYFSNSQRGIVNLALDETEVCISSIDSLGACSLFAIVTCKSMPGWAFRNASMHRSSQSFATV